TEEENQESISDTIPETLESIIENAQKYEEENNVKMASGWNFKAFQWYETEGDDELAFGCLKKACEQDDQNLPAVIRIGKCFENGELGQEKDLEKASNAYHHAAFLYRHNPDQREECFTQCKN